MSIAYSYDYSCINCSHTWIGSLEDEACPKCHKHLTNYGVRLNVEEKDPTGRSQHEPGAKLDLGKSPVRRGLLEYFPRACLAVADISQFGATKYAWKGWETVPDGVDRYGDAEARHICFAAIEGPITADSKMLHAAHEAWNALARLELILRQKDEQEGIDREQNT